MSTGNSIQGSVGVDLGPLKRDFAEAENVARAGGQRVQRALAAASAVASRQIGTAVPINWQNVAAGTGLVDPVAERRRRNSARGFAPAPRGKYQLPIPDDDMDERSRRRGRGGAFGVIGAGAAVTGFGALVGAFVRANEAAGSLRERVSEITSMTGTGAFRGATELQANIKGAADALDEIRTREIVESGGGMGGAWPLLGAGVKMWRHASTGGSDTEDARQKAELQRRMTADISAYASKLNDANSVRSKSLFLSERQSELDEEEIRHREQLGTLSAMERNGINNPAARQAEVTRNTLARETINRRFNSEGRERSFQAGQQGIAEGVARGAMSPRAARMAQARSRQARASRRAFERGLPEEERERRQAESRAANLEVFEESFQQSEAMRGPEGAETRRAERRDQRRRSAFFARGEDATARKARGAKDEIALGDAPRAGKNGGDGYNEGPSEAFKTLEPLVKDLVTQLTKLNDE